MDEAALDALEQALEMGTKIIPRGTSTSEEIVFTNIKAWLDGIQGSSSSGEAALIIEAMCGRIRQAVEAIRALREQVKEPNYKADYEQERGHADVLAQKLDMAFCRLAECYRLTGADPDGNSDARLAPYAVDEVRRLRHDHDALAQEHARLRAALKALCIDANRLCDRMEGGTYEEDCRRAIAATRTLLAASQEGKR